MSRRHVWFFVVFLLASTTWAFAGPADPPLAGVISTIAGSGVSGLAGDGGPATLARLYNPFAVAVDGAGTVFIADYFNNRLRKVATDGTISTVAIPQLNRPTALAVDSVGNVYVADVDRVRKLNAGAGQVTTVAGGGSVLGDGGPATSAQLDHPYGLTVDAAGNVYISDSRHHRIRKVTASTGLIATIAGTGTGAFGGDGGPATAALLYEPYGLAIDAMGNLFIADAFNWRVRQVSAATGIITTVAGLGFAGFSGESEEALEARLRQPWGLAVDPAGNLYIADSSNQRIRKLDPGTGLITTVAGNSSERPAGDLTPLGDAGPAPAALLSDPAGIALDAAGNLYIADTSANRIRKVTPPSVPVLRITTLAGNEINGFGGDGGPAVLASIKDPSAIARDAAGNLYIADSGNNRIRKINAATGVITTVAAGTTARLEAPSGVAVDAAGNLYVSELYTFLVRKVTPAGAITTFAGGGRGLGDGGPATAAGLSYPSDVAVDLSGNVYIAERGGNRVRKVLAATGVITTIAGNGAAGANGDGGAATAAQLSGPEGVAVDAAGNVYIADTGNNRVRKVFAATGLIVTVAGSGVGGFSGEGGPATDARLDDPTGVAVDGIGDVYIADTSNHRIRKLTAASGILTTVAGSGVSSFNFGGDGGAAIAAQLFNPSSLAVGGAGSLYIVDTGNHRIRQAALIVPPPPPLTLNLPAGGTRVASTGGTGLATRAGYASVSVDSGPAPFGTAVFSLTQNGAVVSEAGVPASPPTQHARIFVDYRTGVASGAGTLNVYTGFAIVNRTASSATLLYYLRDRNGEVVGSGQSDLAAGAHMAKFIQELKDVAPGFNVPANFPAAIRFGSLEIVSSQPISVVALRLTTNQRGDTLLTSTPVRDSSLSANASPLYFPQLADGGGYTTTLALLSTSSLAESGTLAIFDDNGAPLIIREAGGSSGSTFAYSIPPSGVFVLQTDGSAAEARVGWVQLTPDSNSLAPAGAGVFSYSRAGILVTESGVPTAIPTTSARIYVDKSGGHDTGLAIANPGSSPGSITVQAFENNGSSAAGNGAASITILPNGHSARFIGQFVAGLPEGFTGVARISSSSPFVALTLRSLVNSRGDFLLTTFPVADDNRAAPEPIVFPQIADGGGYQTQFIFISAAGAATVTVSVVGDDGAPMNVGAPAP